MTETTNNTNGNGSNSTITRPCSVRTMINAMADNGWGYIPNRDKKGRPTRQAHKYTCPACEAKRLKEGKSKTLAERSSRNVVVFFKKDRPKVALCHVCTYKKKEGQVEAPTPPTKAMTPEDATPEVRTCTRKGCNNPLPPDRKAVCHSCKVPSKKAQMKANQDPQPGAQY